MGTSRALSLIWLTLILMLPCRTGAGSRVVYLGRDMASGGAWVQDENGTQYRVGLGDAIAGLGTLTEISEGRLVCRYKLSDTEKQDLRRQHAVVYDVREVQIPRLDLRILPMAR